MKIKLKYIYYGIVGVLLAVTLFFLISGIMRVNKQKKAVEQAAQNMETLVDQAVKACYDNYDFVNLGDDEKAKLKVYEDNIASTENLRVKAGIATSMIDYAIRTITNSNFQTTAGSTEAQEVDPAHNLALQALTQIQTQLVNAQSSEIN